MRRQVSARTIMDLDGDNAVPQAKGGQRSIVLVGLMGAGKTCVGKRLAPRLGLPFVDADHEIELAAGCSIPEIFEQHGEAAFRDGERRVIARLLSGPPIVLATGGGAFMDERTRALVKESAISVWIRADLELLVQRTSRKQNRPLLERGNKRQILTELSAQRAPFYALADIAVDSGDGPPDETVDRIVKQLAACQGLERPVAEMNGTV